MFTVDTVFNGGLTSRPHPGFYMPPVMDSCHPYSQRLSNRARVKIGGGEDSPACSQSMILRVTGQYLNSLRYLGQIF